jgi:flagellar hook-associated protein 1 FlgK
MDARDGALLETSDRLDQFAWELGNRINEIHRAGYGSNGDTGYDLFTMTTQNRAAREININQELVEDPTLVGAAGSALVGSGDNTNVMAMLETENENVGGLGGPPRAVLGDTIGRYGSLAKRSISTAEAETVARDYLIGMRDSASGVSVDEELIELTKAQRAFEAMSKVADTTNQMLETILNLR